MKRFKTLTVLLAATLATSLLFAAFAFADGRKVVTLGTGLSAEQQASIMRFFGVKEGEAEIIYVSIEDEIAHLGAYVPREQIGNSTNSCAMVNPTLSGGIRVKTANLNYVTSEMIAATLATSGVKNCEVIAACPFVVSGTGALTGVMMAYETASGQALDEDKKDLATQELVTTGELSQTLGQAEATMVMNDIKINVIREEVNVQQDVEVVVNNVVETTINAIEQRNEYAGMPGTVTLTQEEYNMLYDYAQRVAQMDYNYEDVQPTLEMVAVNTAVAANVEDPIIETLDVAATEPEALAEDSILVTTDDTALGEDVLLGSTDAEALPPADESGSQAETPAQEPEPFSEFEISTSSEYGPQEPGSEPEDPAQVPGEESGDPSEIPGEDQTFNGEFGPGPESDPALEGQETAPGTEPLPDEATGPIEPGSEADEQHYDEPFPLDDSTDANQTEPGSEFGPGQEEQPGTEDGLEQGPDSVTDPASQTGPEADTQATPAPGPAQTLAGDGVSLNYVRTLQGVMFGEKAVVDGSDLLKYKGDNGLYGLMDLEGNVLTPAQYQYNFYADRGYIQATLDGDDVNNTVLLKTDGTPLFDSTYAAVGFYGKQWAVGAAAVPSNASLYDFGNAATQAYYVIDHYDLYYLPNNAAAPTATLSRDRFADAYSEGSYINVLDRSTQVVSGYDSNFSLVEPTVANLKDYNYPDKAFVQVIDDSNLPAIRVGINDAQGNVVVPAVFDSLNAPDVQSGLVKAQINNLYGLVDTGGNVIVPLEYDSVNANLAAPMQGNDTNGDWPYEANGYFNVEKNGLTGFVTWGGEVTVEPSYPAAESMVRGAALVVAGEDGMVNLVAADGTVTQYDQASGSVLDIGRTSGMLWTLSTPDGATVIDWHGNALLSMPYDNAEASGDGKYLVVFNVNTNEAYVYGITYDAVEHGQTATIEELYGTNTVEAPAQESDQTPETAQEPSPQQTPALTEDSQNTETPLPAEVIPSEDQPSVPQEQDNGIEVLLTDEASFDTETPGLTQETAQPEAPAQSELLEASVSQEEPSPLPDSQQSPEAAEEQGGLVESLLQVTDASANA